MTDLRHVLRGLCRSPGFVAAAIVTLAVGIAANVTVYALIGAVFAIAFVMRGIDSVDEAARNSGIGFRLIVMPGAAALWPLLLRKWPGAKS